METATARGIESALKLDPSGWKAYRSGYNRSAEVSFLIKQQEKEIVHK